MIPDSKSKVIMKSPGTFIVHILHSKPTFIYIKNIFFEIIAFIKMFAWQWKDLSDLFTNKMNFINPALKWKQKNPQSYHLKVCTKKMKIKVTLKS